VALDHDTLAMNGKAAAIQMITASDKD